MVNRGSIHPRGAIDMTKLWTRMSKHWRNSKPPRTLTTDSLGITNLLAIDLKKSVANGTIKGSQITIDRKVRSRELGKQTQAVYPCLVSRRLTAGLARSPLAIR